MTVEQAIEQLSKLPLQDKLVMFDLAQGGVVEVAEIAHYGTGMVEVIPASE